MANENELRKDYLLNEWVIISSTRGKRPHDFEFQKPRETREPKKNCPFCPGNEAMTPNEVCRVERNGLWKVRVFPNLFAAVTKQKKFSRKKGLLESITPYGFHEVVVETPEHGKQLAELEEGEMLAVLEAFASRFRELKKKRNVEYILVLKNQGRECGASRSHSHSQIVTFPFLPPVPAMEEKESKRFFEREGECVYCRVVEKERESARKIFENNGFLVIAPFASRWPYESLVLSKGHKSNLLEFQEKELMELSKALLKLFTAYKALSREMPYNMVIHQSMNSVPFYHFHIEVMPNIHKIYGGIEKGAGVVLNEVAPEKAAKELGKKIK